MITRIAAHDIDIHSPVQVVLQQLTFSDHLYMIVHNDFRWKLLRPSAGTVKDIQLSSGYGLEVWWVASGHFEAKESMRRTFHNHAAVL